MKTTKILFTTIIFLWCATILIQAVPPYEQATLSLKKLFSELKAAMYLDKQLHQQDHAVSEQDHEIIAALDYGLTLTESMASLISQTKNPYSDIGIRLYGKLFSSLSQENNLQWPHQIRDFEKKCQKFHERLKSYSSLSQSHAYLYGLIEVMQSTICPLCYKDMGFGEYFIDSVWHRPKEFMCDYPVIPATIGLCAGLYLAHKGYSWFVSSRTGKVAASGVMGIDCQRESQSGASLNNATLQGQLHVQQFFSLPQASSDCGYFALVNGILVQADPSGALMRNVAQHAEALHGLVNTWKNSIRQRRSNRSCDYLLRDEIEELMSRDNIALVQPQLRALGVGDNALQFGPDNRLVNMYILEQDPYALRENPRNAIFAFDDQDVNGIQHFRDEQSNRICVIANTPGHWVSLVAQRREHQLVFVDSANRNYQNYFYLIQGIAQLLFTQTPMISYQMAMVRNQLGSAQESFDRGNIYQARNDLNLARQAAQQYHNNPNFREIRLQLEQMSAVLHD